MLRAALAAVLVAVTTAATAHPAARVDPPRRADPASLAAYGALTRDYAVEPGMFRDSDRPYAQAWPLSQAVAATAAVAALPDAPAALAHALRRQERALERYRRGDAYDSSVRAPLGGGGPQFYDDNEWIGLDLVRIGTVLRDGTAIKAARRIFRFAVSGWDTSATHACPGGVFWEASQENRDRNTVSTANAALLALELYGVARDPRYLEWAQRLVGWVHRCLTDSDGLAFDHVDLAGTVDRARWSYNQGAMIAAESLLGAATGDSSLLDRAERLARATLDEETADGWGGEPAVFVAIFFRDVRVLERIRPRPEYRAALGAYLAQHPGGAGGRFGSTLLDQAAYVQLLALRASA